MDRISELPDDVIAKIISCLSLKQAAKTSLISTRWRDLWKQLYSGFFDFDGSETVHGLRSQYMDVFDSLTRDYLDDRADRKRVEFVNWVNQVLRSHKAATIERFRVIFDLMDVSDHVIDSWIQIAASKNVKWIELDFSCFGTQCLSSTSYSFLSGSNCRFLSLTNLSLNNVEIAAESFECLLVESPNLEKLNVCGSTLQSLKLYSLSLKHLSLEFCNRYKPVDHSISAPNLLSLTYAPGDANKAKLVLQDVPQLKNVNIDCYQLCQFQSHLSQLHELELRLCGYFSVNTVVNEPELPNLKKLTMTGCDINDYSFRSFVAYLQSAPLLESLTLELQLCGNIKLTVASWNMTEGHRYSNLKTVKLRGYEAKEDIEIIRFFLSRAPLLDKIIIDPCPRYMMGGRFENYYRGSRAHLEDKERVNNCIYTLMSVGLDITRDHNKIVVC